MKSDLPYYEVPEYPEVYSAGTVAGRMMDGLGFRYYWASEGLRDEDLAYKPSEDGRTCAQTIDHILGLTNTILNAVKQVPNTSGSGADAPQTFDEKRKQTLLNIQEASEIVKTAGTLEDYDIVFQRGDNENRFPFWNILNGPLADAIWHCGQLVSFRRASGNPFNSKASMLTGTVRE